MDELKKIFEKTFRYPAVDIYMLFSFFIAFMALFIGLSLFSEVWRYNSDSNEDKYRSGYRGCVQFSDLDINLNNADFGEKGVICFEEAVFSVCMGDTEMPAEGTVCLNKCENAYPLISGEWFDSDADNISRCVVIGKGYSDNLHIYAGDSLLIEGEEYTVKGVAGSKYSDIYDYVIALNIRQMGDRTLRSLLGQNVNLTARSEDTDAQTIYLGARENLRKAAPGAVFSEEGGYEKRESDKDNAEAVLYCAMYVFALFHCLIAADVWINERKYEIAVKKCLGYSENRLFMDLFLQQMRLTLSAAVLCFFVQTVVKCAGGTFLGMNVELTAGNLIIILVFVTISAFLCVALPLGNARDRFYETINGGWE